MTDRVPALEVIRVLIADDQALFRRGLYVVLGTEDGIEVVAEAENGADAVAKAQELAPDVILMDVRMPRISGVEATAQIRDLLPSTKVLMLTVSDEEDDLYEAIKAGASGYLLKEISIEEVAEAVRAVYQGQSLISPSMASKLFNEFTQLARRASEQIPVPVPVLTARELEVLSLMARSKSNREIAEALFITMHTVADHLGSSYSKLDITSREQLAVALESSTA